MDRVTVGMMTFPTEWKVIKFLFQTTNQKEMWCACLLDIPFTHRSCAVCLEFELCADMHTTLSLHPNIHDPWNPLIAYSSPMILSKISAILEPFLRRKRLQFHIEEPLDAALLSEQPRPRYGRQDVDPFSQPFCGKKRNQTWFLWFQPARKM